MSSFGLQFYNSNGFFASPDFTPITLCDVININLSTLPVINQWGGLGSGSIRPGRKIKTKIPNGVLLSVFYRRMNEKNSSAYYFSATPGDDGYQDIFVWPTSAVDEELRFYVFANYVTPASVPEWGVYFYENERIYYHGASLPLQLKFFSDAPNSSNSNLPKGKSFAVMSTFYRHFSSQVLHSEFWFSWVADSTKISTGAFWSEGNTSAGGIDLTWKGVFYIETEVYDEYYQIALGY